MSPSDALIWGPYSLPVADGTQHFLVSGTTGSGKTILIDLLMRSLLTSPRMRDNRALIYDAKQEAIPKLKALGLSDRVRVLHPFDARCSPWDVASDIDDPLSARQFAQILIPETERQGGSSSFFDDACRDIVAVTVLTLSLCTPDKKWTFRDLLLALLYPENLEAILSRNTTYKNKPFPNAKRIWSSYFDPATTDDRTRNNVRASLNAKLSVYEPVAAAWEQATEPPFSFVQWHKNNGNEILVLGNDEAARAAIDPINRAIFQRVAELTLARPEGQSSQTWFFLDEVREAGKLQTLNPLLLKGRSKGACVVLSFQDIDGMRDVYGTHLANEIVANCNNVALLRTNSASTAEWASQMFGKFFVIDKDHTEGVSGTEISSSQTKRLSERPAVLSGELLFLPLPSEKTGIVGFFRDAKAKADEPKRYTLGWTVLNQYPSQSDSFQPIKRDELILEPWTAADLRRLRITLNNSKAPDPDNSDDRLPPPARKR